ncbi:MAG TPA: 50S ribosomal protein L39e [Patescibacteria group bacterium]|jgi:large subunit ribosomal protein L39e|nr:50S ribosomal protein L39e [Patescibacteria group bacterium]
MARNKHVAYKTRLSKAGRQKKSVPAWIIAKTMGKVRWSPKSRRNWRNRKLRI